MANYGGFNSWEGVPHGGMRASDADRERAVDVLKAGFAEGRLSREEYEQRVEAAYRSSTYGELAMVVRDLPQGPLPPAPQPPGYGPPLPVVPPGYLPVPQRPTNGLAIASLLCGLAGTFLGLPSLAAIVLGHLARRRIRESGENGESAATAGAVLGYLGLTAWVLVVMVAGGG